MPRQKNSYSRGLFITGTSTEVGKTVITVGIACVLKKYKNIKVGVMKPIQTGSPSDIEFILKVLDDDISAEERRLMNVYSFDLPASPHLAASVANKRININRIIKAYKELSNLNDLVLVEGIGGLMVPITESFLLIELIKRLNLPVVIVSFSGLGTINHTLLSILAAKLYNIPIIGIIMNKFSSSLIEEDNARIIEKLSKIKIIAKIPYIDNIEDKEEITKIFLKYLNIDTFLKFIYNPTSYIQKPKTIVNIEKFKF